jgi:prolyl-tRNA synthetase
MRQSQLFTKTRREAPKDETAKNADLLIRAGFIHKMQAGVYSYLPLGERVIRNIVSIIRDEMNGIGGQEVVLASLQDRELWTKTGRWDDAVVDNWFKTKLKNDTEVGLGFTHEEPLTMIMRDNIRSFRDLPQYVYQFQTKFRNEKRAKSGILRGREFLMKDLYSFSRTPEEHAAFYEKAKAAYVRIFKRMSLSSITFTTFASGGTFSQFSDEFQMLTDAGEDIIHVDREARFAANEEVLSSISDDQLTAAGTSRDRLVPMKAVELGNIFNLGTKFSEPLELFYQDENGEKIPVIMGSYGIGIPRLMGGIVEALGDEKGLVWPLSVAPFHVHLIQVTGQDPERSVAIAKRANDLYEKMQAAGIDVLLDDRDVRPGEKFADADLIGIPYRAVIGEKVAEGEVEVKARTRSDDVSMMSVEDLIKLVKGHIEMERG